MKLQSFIKTPTMSLNKNIAIVVDFEDFYSDSNVLTTLIYSISYNRQNTYRVAGAVEIIGEGSTSHAVAYIYFK